MANQLNVESQTNLQPVLVFDTGYPQPLFVVLSLMRNAPT